MRSSGCCAGIDTWRFTAASSPATSSALWERFSEIDRVWLEQKIRSVFLLKNYAFSTWRDRPYLFKLELHRPLFGDPEIMRQDVTFIPIFRPSSEDVESVAIVVANAQEAFHYKTALAASVGELQAAYAELRSEVAARGAMESELRRVQHLDALRRLAGGIAHEINTPLQFTTDSMAFVEESLHGLLDAVDKYKHATQAMEAQAGGSESAPAVLSESHQEDIDYVREAAPGVMETIKHGLDRVAKIVQSMKEFAREDASVQSAADINRAIENSIAVANSAFAQVVELSVDLGDVPGIVCDVGSFKLTMLNLIVNAAHAIEDVVGKTGAKGRIHIASRLDRDAVEISIADTGCGIPEQVRAKIFDPFFSTKEVGRGSGQGLALAYSTVVKQHGGRLTFDTEVGKGTTFLVRLPVAGGRNEPARTVQLQPSEAAS